MVLVLVVLVVFGLSFTIAWRSGALTGSGVKGSPRLQTCEVAYFDNLPSKVFDVLQAPENSLSIQTRYHICKTAIDGWGIHPGARSLAHEYCSRHYEDNAARCRALVNTESTKAFAEGTMLGMGDFVTASFTIPADLLVNWAMQARLVATIAIIYELSHEADYVRTVIIMAILGETVVTDALRTSGSHTAERLTAAALQKIPGKTLRAINKQLGFCVITRSGQKGLVNLMKWVPFVGSLANGVINVGGMWAAGGVATDYFAR